MEGEEIPRINEYQISFRVDTEMYMYLHETGNYTQYIIQLINKDRENNSNKEYLKSLKQSYKEKIAEIDKKLKEKVGSTAQVKEILEYGLKGYINRNSEVLIGASQNRLWIRGSILPELKKAGSRLSEYDVLKMFEEGEIE